MSCAVYFSKYLESRLICDEKLALSISLLYEMDEFGFGASCMVGAFWALKPM